MGDDGAAAGVSDRVWETRDDHQYRLDGILPSQPNEEEVLEILPRLLAPKSTSRVSVSPHCVASTSEGRSTVREWSEVLSGIETDIGDALSTLSSTLASIHAPSHEHLSAVEARIEACQIALKRLPRSGVTSLMQRKEFVEIQLKDVINRAQFFRTIVKAPDGITRKYNVGEFQELLTECTPC